MNQVGGTYIFTPVNNIKGVVHVIHGMAEHFDRYREFASFLNDHGYVVCGTDLPGHGRSVGEKKGYFKSHEDVVKAVLELNKSIREMYNGMRIICFGHSMGSFFAEYIASKHKGEFDAYVFSGTQGVNGIIPLAKFIAGIEVLFRGEKHESKLLSRLSFGMYNKAFKPTRTDFDWLTRDHERVVDYVKDDLCGFTFTSKAYFEMFKVLKEVNSSKWAKSLDKDLKYLFVSGDRDPVSNNGKGVLKLVERMKKANVKDVRVKLYEDCRHELLNELNREMVFKDILDFIEEAVS
ncbi:MAG: alpha/beta fold hydrolase [Clostridia bacterium]|jgi:alpha-beta hydrolase superfamily lysophospholipase